MNKNHVTIVTGASRGIGREIALRMAKETAVLAVATTKEELETLCAEIRSAGGVADFVVGDVGKQKTAIAAVKKALRRGWTVRNLVCNAGIAKGGATHTMDPAVWQKMFEVNVHGTFYFMHACLPHMIEQKAGSISVISSIVGLRGAKYESGYAATKAALIRLAECVALENVKHNITVVPLCPGFVETDMTERTIAGLIRHRAFTRDEAIKLISSKNPQGRILKPLEIAEAVAFVASPAAKSCSSKPMELIGLSDPRVLKLVNWLSTNASAAKELIIPVSGGSDSALCFALCSMAYPGKTTAVFMGKREDMRCADYFESIGRMEYVEDVTGTGDNLEIARWARLLEMSNTRNAWLVGSRNHTEELTGFYSLASRLATFMPLANVWKSEVMELCQAIGVPEAVMASSRKADPDCGRPAEMAEIPLELLDLYLQVCEGLRPESDLAKLTNGQLEYLKRFIAQNSFRRYLPTQGPRL